MHCIHCQSTIEKTLKRKHISSEVDLANKQVRIMNDADKDTAISAIKACGFNPTL